MGGTPKTLSGFLGLDSPDPITLIGERIRRARTLGELIDILSGIPKQLFTSEDHYRYYRTYVVPKLRLVGRSYTQGHPVREWQAFRHSFSLEVALGRSYVVLGVRRVIEPIREVGESFIVVRERAVRTYAYILGLNSDGRLFVNRVPPALTGLHGNLVSHLGEAVVREVEDVVIAELLGFNRSVDLYDEVTIADEGNYRVQGEVVVSVNQFWTGSVDSIEDYYRRVVTAMEVEVQNYVRYLAYDRVMVELQTLGFSARFIGRAARDEIRIVDAIYYGDDSDKKAAAVAVALCKRLGGRVYNSGVCTCEVEDRALGRFSVTVDTSRIPYGGRYGDIVVKVYTYRGSRVALDLLREFEERVRSLPRGNFRFMLGNHLIEVEGGYSTSVAYTPSVQPLALPPRLLSITGNAFYVDTQSRVRVTHPEHGVITLRFARPFMISFTTTGVDERYPGEVNRVILRKLIKEYEGEVLGLARGYVDPYAPHLPVGANAQVG